MSVMNQGGRFPEFSPWINYCMPRWRPERQTAGIAGRLPWATEYERYQADRERRIKSGELRIGGEAYL